MIVGLTGGIATGKSTFSAQLRAQGLPVIDADVLAREVVAPGTDGLAEIVDTFGAVYLTPNGELDRVRMGAAVFADESMREKLNAIIHPRVRAGMWAKAREITAGDARQIAILDVPLLMEGGTHTLVDVTVLVYASTAIQYERLIARNDLTYEQARARIEAQWPIDQKRDLADIVVDNAGGMDEVPRLAQALGEHLKALAQRGATAEGTFDKSVVERMTIR
ncbi:MAG: dephospho-CoA kinase [Firmicutes bacterium]|nr:dephospho-CoA kinase [Bacillota bacterium]